MTNKSDWKTLAQKKLPGKLLDDHSWETPEDNKTKPLNTGDDVVVEFE